MSRTYRRRRYRQLFGSDNPLMDFNAYSDDIVWEDVEYIKYNWDYGWYLYPRYTVKYKANSKTGRKLVAVAKSDSATNACKEPGPSWARRLYTDRPAKRAAKRELQKFMNNPDYEPMILAMEPLPYWT